MHSLAEGKILQVPFFLVLDFSLSVSNWEEMESEEFEDTIIDGLQQTWIEIKERTIC